MGGKSQEQSGVSRRQILGSVTGATIVGFTGVSSAADRISKSRFVETGLYLDTEFGSKEMVKYPVIFIDKPMEYRISDGSVATSERASKDVIQLIKGGRNIIRDRGEFHKSKVAIGGGSEDIVPIQIGDNSIVSKELQVSQPVSLPSVAVRATDGPTIVEREGARVAEVSAGENKSLSLDTKRVETRVRLPGERAEVSQSFDSKEAQAKNGPKTPTETTTLEAVVKLGVTDHGFIEVANGGNSE